MPMAQKTAPSRERRRRTVDICRRRQHCPVVCGKGNLLCGEKRACAGNGRARLQEEAACIARSVVEDEAQEARHLTDLLTRYGKQHGVEFKVTWHSSAMEMLSDKGHYDLCLLDIEMPGINGMEAAGLLRTYDETIPIIFVTNLAKYAVKGYEVGALGFIVKPVSYGGLSLSLDRALRAIGANAGRSVAVPTEDGVRVVPLRSIIYVEVTKHRLTYHIENEEPLEARGSLVQLEEELAEAPVVRVSKSCLANMDKISLVRNAEVQMTNGDLLRISRTHKKEVVDKVTDYLGDRR